MAPGSTYNQELAKKIIATTPIDTQARYSHLAQLAPRSMKAANTIVASKPRIPLTVCTASELPERANKFCAAGIQYPVPIASRLTAHIAISSHVMMVTDVGRFMFVTPR